MQLLLRRSDFGAGFLGCYHGLLQVCRLRTVFFFKKLVTVSGILQLHGHLGYAFLALAMRGLFGPQLFDRL